MAKKYEKEIFFCAQCPEYQMSWIGVEYCKKANARIYDKYGGFPKDCPLKDL
jgi:hypothetical protein